MFDVKKVKEKYDELARKVENCELSYEDENKAYQKLGNTVEIEISKLIDFTDQEYSMLQNDYLDKYCDCSGLGYFDEFIANHYMIEKIGDLSLDRFKKAFMFYVDRKEMSLDQKLYEHPEVVFITIFNFFKYNRLYM